MSVPILSGPAVAIESHFHKREKTFMKLIKSSLLISLLSLLTLVSYQAKAQDAIAGVNGLILTATGLMCPELRSEFAEKVVLKSHDGLDINAILLTPKTTAPANGHPLVIFNNPWSFTSEIYCISSLPQKLLKSGIAVVLLDNRGMVGSEGVADFGGAKDMADLKMIIPQLVGAYNLDADNIGLTGLSYGGAISTLALANDVPVKTVVPVSGWVDILDGGLYEDKVTDLKGAEFLYNLGMMNKVKLGDTVWMMDELMEGNAVPELFDFSNQRSPLKLTDKINESNKSIFIVHTYNDAIFEPNRTMDFFKGLTINKKISFFPGQHGSTTALDGLFPSGLGDDIRDWFVYWLKGEGVDPGVGTVNFAIRNQSERAPLAFGERAQMRFSEWSNDNLKKETFYLSSQDKMKLTKELPSTSDHIALEAASDTDDFTNGTMDITHIAEVILTEAYYNVNSIKAPYGAVFKGPTLSPRKILGKSNLELYLSSDLEQVQFSAYVFAESIFGNSNFVSRTSYVVRDFVDGVAKVNVDFDLTAFNWTTERLVLVVYGNDPDFAPMPENRFKILSGKEFPSKLDLRYQN